MFRINTLSSCLFNCVSTVVFATLGLMCWDVWSDSREIPLEEPALHDYLPHVEELREQGRLGEAIAVGNFLETQEDMPHRDEIIQIRDEIIVEQSSWFSRSGRFLTGFVTGNATSMEGMAGTVISDFLVIGDVRDLGKQGYNWIVGEEVDKFITTLSGVGLVASVATFAPEPSSTAAGVATQPVLAMLKVLKRLGALSRRQVDSIMRMGRRVVETKKLGDFKQVLVSYGGVAKHAPSGTVPMLVKHTDSMDDVARVSDWVRAAPDETASWFSLKGAAAVDDLRQAARIPKPQLVRWLRHGGKIKLAARGTKTMFRGRMAELQSILRDWLLGRPELRWLLLAGVAIAGYFMVASGEEALHQGRVAMAGRERQIV